MTRDDLLALLAEPLVHLGPVPVPGWAAGLGLLLAAVVLLRRRPRAGEAASGAELDAALARLDAILASQAETNGRVHAMAEHLGARQSDLARAVSERLDGMTARVGQTLRDSAGQTGASLSVLAERLAVIDRAQSEIRDLAGEMVRLQDILSDKQARGAFGEGRMRAIVADALPASAYAFNAPLPNGKRPDCLVSMGREVPPLAIDAKFPLEAFLAYREADTEDARTLAARRVARDMEVHARAISEKYLLPGRTQEVALMFVPSESVFADLHEHFPDALERAQRLRVLVVSPSLLLLALQLARSICKDARMREEAHRIQREVALIAEDVERLAGRVTGLQTHFGQALRDIEAIVVSAEKLRRRGIRVAEIDVGETPAVPVQRGFAPAE